MMHGAYQLVGCVPEHLAQLVIGIIASDFRSDYHFQIYITFAYSLKDGLLRTI